MNCKRIIAALLCAAIPFGIADLSAAAPIALYAEAATVTAGGTCGKNLTWQLDSSGTLTVSGTGNMDEALDRTPCPWKDLKDDIKKIVIGKGVTSIGMGMFSYCNNLTSLSLPSTLKNIDTYSFVGCKSLTSVVIPNGVTNIGSSAFLRCEKLSSITIPKSVTYIGALAFLDTPWFESQKSIDDPFIIINGLLVYVDYDLSGDVVIHSSVNKICEQAAERRSKITSLTIPETVTEIGFNAFLSCSSLKTVTIPASVKEIKQQAFYKCESLEEIYILNPECNICEHWNTTISNDEEEYSGVIRGYKGSTAEKYAEKYGYTFKALAQLGDVNSDDHINAVDASSVLSYYASISTNKDGGFDYGQKLAADVDRSGVINAVDASNILAYYAFNATSKDKISFEEYLENN
ncbi:leucine-rich repeat protein [Ruminococcus flavefaciens]|uniref:leucine-rich repeat protein n=1 Tax=Ruminococcus flavefaciens TaxID=1265 RepID=UPI000464FA91|nr:leucine-rich repeat protein [Ruminococcus flavefaciens]